MKQPTITLLEASPAGRFEYRRYRISGGDIAPDWQKSANDHGAWCEISLAIADDEPWEVGSFGGGVWPSAWPALFDSQRGSAQQPVRVLVTDIGRALLNAALCTRCLDLGESVPATHGELCDGCHVSAGEAQDRAAAEEQY